MVLPKRRALTKAATRVIDALARQLPLIVRDRDAAFAEISALRRWATTFWEFQQPWVFEMADMAICNKARQIGYSHSSAAIGVLWGAYCGETTTIISIGQEESDEVLQKARGHATLLQRLGSQLARTRKSNASELEFASGGRILALPSSGGRGYTGNVFLDEFAYQEQAQKVWDNAAPATQLGFKVRVQSTPNGVGNEFHTLWTQAQQKGTIWRPYQKPIQIAKAEGYPLDMKKLWTIAKGDPRIFAQLYECNFLDNEFQYVPTEAIDACAKELYLAGKLPAGEHYAGLDIGRTIDLTVLVILRVIAGIRFVVDVKVIKRTDWDGLELMVARAFEAYKLRRLCIDATGLGEFPAERIKKKHSERIDVPHRRPRVELIRFTPTSKEDLATGLYTSFTTKSVRLPPTDAALVQPAHPGVAELLRKDVASIRRIVTNAGNVTYDAPHTSEGHADSAWALALGLHACSTPNPMLEALASANAAGMVAAIRR